MKKLMNFRKDELMFQDDEDDSNDEFRQGKK
jgi:hypothetical protein